MTDSSRVAGRQYDILSLLNPVIRAFTAYYTRIISGQGRRSVDGRRGGYSTPGCRQPCWIRAGAGPPTEYNYSANITYITIL